MSDIQFAPYWLTNWAILIIRLTWLVAAGLAIPPELNPRAMCEPMRAPISKLTPIIERIICLDYMSILYAGQWTKSKCLINRLKPNYVPAKFPSSSHQSFNWNVNNDPGTWNLEPKTWWCGNKLCDQARPEIQFKCRTLITGKGCQTKIKFGHSGLKPIFDLIT